MLKLLRVPVYIFQEQDTINEKVITQQHMLNEERLLEAQSEALRSQHVMMGGEQVIMEPLVSVYM